MRCSLTTIIRDSLDARLPCEISDALRAQLYAFAGRGVRNIEIIDGYLIITLTDGTVINLGFVGSKTYTHRQTAAAAEWVIRHDLVKFPAVTVVDSGENAVMGDVQYIDDHILIIRFSAPFSGKAYLN